MKELTIAQLVLICIFAAVVGGGLFELFKMYRIAKQDGVVTDDESESLMSRARTLGLRFLQEAVELYNKREMPRNEIVDYTTMRIMEVVQKGDVFTDEEKEFLSRDVIRAVVETLMIQADEITIPEEPEES